MKETHYMLHRRNQCIYWIKCSYPPSVPALEDSALREKYVGPKGYRAVPERQMRGSAYRGTAIQSAEGKALALFRALDDLKKK